MPAMKLSLDRENILEFNVDIQGYANTSTTKAPKVRMILEQKNMGFCMVATKEDKTYSVVIPEMKNIMESGVCDARMEVIIDNKYFVPWESKIEFDREVKVEAAPIIREEQEPDLSVQVKPIIKEEPKPEPVKPVVKEETAPKPKKKATLQLIVDNKPKRKIKKDSSELWEIGASIYSINDNALKERVNIKKYIMEENDIKVNIGENVSLRIPNIINENVIVKLLSTRIKE